MTLAAAFVIADRPHGVCRNHRLPVCNRRAQSGTDREWHHKGDCGARTQSLAEPTGPSIRAGARSCRFDVAIWYAIAVPRAVPAAILQKLRDSTVAAMDLPTVKEQMRWAPI